MARADTIAAEEALRLATSRLESASAAVARWMPRRGRVVVEGPQLRRACTSWEKAWREYRLALAICLAICPRRLNRGQKILARLPRED